MDTMTYFVMAVMRRYKVRDAGNVEEIVLLMVERIIKKTVKMSCWKIESEVEFL